MSGCFEPAFIAASVNRPGDLAQGVAAYSDVNFRRALGLPLEVGLGNPARSGLIGTCRGMRCAWMVMLWMLSTSVGFGFAFTVIAWDGPGAGHSSATSTGSPASRAPALDQTGRVSWASTRFSSRSRAVPESLRLADYADCLSRVPARLGPGPPGDARKKIRRQWRAFVLTTGCINFNRLRTVRPGLSALEMWPYWLALGRA
jgi:hypothetical protein